MAEENPTQKQPEELGSRMSISEHLDELRKRLFRASLAVAICFCVSWGFIDDLMGILLRPHYQAVESLRKTWDQREIAKAILAVKAETQDDKSKEALDQLVSNLEEKAFPQALAETQKNYPEPAVSETLKKTEEKVRNRPKVELDPRPIVTTYTESMGTYLKAAFIIAMLVAGPYVIWELWGFIAAGLYKRERSFVSRYFPAAVFLFFAGIAFGYFVMIPVGLEFLMNFGGDLVRPEIRISEYFSLFLTLTFALGIIFQIPMIMVILSRIGVVHPSWYRGKWRYVMVACFIVSAVVTPTFDPVNQTLLAGAMYLLYELGILFAKFAYRERQVAIERLNNT